MLAIDVMTSPVVSVSPDASVSEIARLMLKAHISAVPVVDEKQHLAGIVTEGDLLRRAEVGTERKRRRWIEAFTDGGTLAAEYVKSHGRKARDVMTTDVVTVDESTPLHKIADIFESRDIKRVPVMRESQIVGIVSRANLLQALASLPLPAKKTATDDRWIRRKLMAELQGKPWGVRNVIVKNGIVHFWGAVNSEEEREAMRVAAENIAGVRGVKDHTWYPELLPLP
jgi:CBS domain-containing protein